MEDFDVYREGTYQQVLGTGQVRKQMVRIHRHIERPFKRKHFGRILEVGAGIGEHLEFVESSYDEYLLTDLRIDLLVEAMTPRPGLTIEQQDVQNLTYPNRTFDRVIVTCVLAHVPDPALALRELFRVAKPGAKVSIYLPCEPGILLRLARRFITYPKHVRAGVPDPYYFHFREHVHYYSALDHYLRKAFEGSSIRSRYYPLPFGTWNMNLYKIYQIDVLKP